MKNILLLSLAVLVLVPGSVWADSDAKQLVLENQHVRRVLQQDGDVWRTTQLSRADGSDAVNIESDEFLIRMLDGTELTVADYQCEGKPTVDMQPDGQHLSISYLPRDAQRHGTAPGSLDRIHPRRRPLPAQDHPSDLADAPSRRPAGSCTVPDRRHLRPGRPRRADLRRRFVVLRPGVPRQRDRP